MLHLVRGGVTPLDWAETGAGVKGEISKVTIKRISGRIH